MPERKRSFLQVLDTVCSGVGMLLVIQFVVLLLQPGSTESANISLPGCPDSCGGVSIPYPFGIGNYSANCSLSEHFNVNCSKRESSNRPLPYLYDTFEIVNIDLTQGQARMKNFMSSWCYNTTNMDQSYSEWGFNWDGTPYFVNNERNKFVVVGCNTLAYLGSNFSDSYEIGCLSTCLHPENLTNNYEMSCTGVGCCQADIPFGIFSYAVGFDERFNNSRIYNSSPCGFAMVMDKTEFTFNITYLTTYDLIDKPMPVVYDWAIGNTTCKEAQTNDETFACKSDKSTCFDSVHGTGYICNCSKGYDGNPYLDGGCQDINECAANNPCSKPAKCHNFPGGYNCSCPFGWHKTQNGTITKCELKLSLVIGSCVALVALLFMGITIYVILERRDLTQIKKKYFQQYGGWIMLEKIKSNQGFGFTLFTKEELEQATNNFDSGNIIGHGGQGTVYRGTLRNKIVAIKKCKITDESKKKEFGKEMLILSQISHKNIVKLLGCCVEVEVPMLVYEFIVNGTLSHYIQHKRPGSHISLATRLRIARESAEALAYLHTSASPPIFHGDVKSTNILLDENYIAKVSDFGASILAPTDEVQLVTIIQGTCGYLDPEYLQSYQLTDKSDVYSFGVVLLELLTSKPVIDFDAPEEERSLPSRFLSAMKENNMQELLDEEIINEDGLELIRDVAQLARQCLNMKGDERPTMKEVADELDRIGKVKQHPWRFNKHTEETETLLEINEAHHNIES